MLSCDLILQELNRRVVAERGVAATQVVENWPQEFRQPDI